MTTTIRNYLEVIKMARNYDKKVLLIDHEDSGDKLAEAFTKAGATVECRPSNTLMRIIDHDAFEKDLIVLGPGPGRSIYSGYFEEILKEYDTRIPIFGVGAGFEAILKHFKIDLYRLEGKGKESAVPIHHKKEGIFDNIHQDTKMVMSGSQSVREEDAVSGLEVIATYNGLVMGVTARDHQQYQISGVQFRPELKESSEGSKLIKNVLFYVARFMSGGTGGGF